MPSPAPTSARSSQSARRILGALRRRVRRSGPLLTFPDVPGPIHPDDDMKRPEDVDAAHYASVGRSAVAAIERALAAAGRSFDDVQACLDMPCGYGRVLRLLAQEIPGERITACDVNRQAIHAEPPASGPYASIGTQIEGALRERGHFHVSYENALFDYGHAWHTTQYVWETFAAAFDGALQLVSHQPRGWDDHQDVLAFVREA